MHDPMTVAHEIKWPFKDKFGYRKSLITIWHVDPEKDGTDDSCGWFPRSRHGDAEVLRKIQSEFLFNFKHNYWFTKDGYRHFSTSGIVLNMYSSAAWEVFKHNRTKRRDFLNKHLFDILHFAENPFDSIGDAIIGKYGDKINEEAISRLASTVYGDILRKTRPWYKHPKWHIHHWKLQIHWPRLFKRKRIDNAPCDDNLRATV